MATIVPAAGYLTLINTFTVEPDRADELLEALRSSISGTIRHLDGFVSARLHLSDDRRHVANYAQWRSRAAFDAMLNDPRATALREATRAVATHNDAVVYDVRDVIDHAPPDTAVGSVSSPRSASSQRDPWDRALSDYFASRRGDSNA